MSEPTTAKEVMSRLVRSHFNPWQDCIIPNCCLAGWEADLLVIRKSGWAEEVEIKISASDFRCEWTKKADKHEDLRLGNCTQVGYGGRDGFQRANWGSVLPPEADRIIRGNTIYVRDRPTIIRRFWFAMPLTLAEKLLPEVPEHYGLLGIGHHAKVLRPAGVLKPARKLTDAERIHALQTVYTRYWRATVRGESLPEAKSGSDWLLNLEDAA